MLWPIERGFVFSYSPGPATTLRYYPIIPHLDASSCLQVVKLCERRYPSRLDLPAPASQTNFMAHTYLLFDFGTDEEKAQLARQKLERWKQAFRLDKKLQYKLERAEDEAEDASEHAHEAAEKPKAEKPKAKSKAKHKSKETEASEEAPPPMAKSICWSASISPATRSSPSSAGLIAFHPRSHSRKLRPASYAMAKNSLMKSTSSLNLWDSIASFAW